MQKLPLKLGAESVELQLPAETEILTIPSVKPLADPAVAIQTALTASIGSPGLHQIIHNKLQRNPDAQAVVVISDNTRPVPYRGEAGILWPVIRGLLDHGFAKQHILILVATGTHRALSESELRNMLDSRIFETGIRIKNHNCKDHDNLVSLGETSRGSRVLINRDYHQADLKILTGLVESHFMAGVSGGRKSVCPGLIGEESTYVFHGAPMLDSPWACNLQLENNPCHEEALEVARKAGVDYIVNVTLDHQFKVTGVFGGDLEKAHQAAVNYLKAYTGIRIEHEYDMVITHAGFVGINHYQAAKAGVAALPALKPGGRLILVANNTDQDPVGSQKYKTVLHLLKWMGPEGFNRLLLSPDWQFIPDQWQVQMWAKLFAKIPMENFLYYSPQLSAGDYQIIPGRDGNEFLPEANRYQGSLQAIPQLISNALQQAIRDLQAQGRKKISLAYLADGPYGIPTQHNYPVS